jgi:hypothetical protein
MTSMADINEKNKNEKLTWFLYPDVNKLLRNSPFIVER